MSKWLMLLIFLGMVLLVKKLLKLFVIIFSIKVGVIIVLNLLVKIFSKII